MEKIVKTLNEFINEGKRKSSRRSGKRLNENLRFPKEITLNYDDYPYWFEDYFGSNDVKLVATGENTRTKGEYDVTLYISPEDDDRYVKLDHDWFEVDDEEDLEDKVYTWMQEYFDSNEYELVTMSSY